ncbi:hypothetical protein D3C81_1941310 [compost metagenome]
MQQRQDYTGRENPRPWGGRPVEVSSRSLQSKSPVEVSSRVSSRGFQLSCPAWPSGAYGAAVRPCLGIRQIFNGSERPYLPRMRAAEIVTEAGDLISSNPGPTEAIGAQ